MITDMIHSVQLECDESGWRLVLIGTEDDYNFDVHVVAHELLAEATEKLGPWVAEGMTAHQERQAWLAEHGPDEDDEDAYEARDPKHPRHLQLVVDNG